MTLSVSTFPAGPTLDTGRFGGTLVKVQLTEFTNLPEIYLEECSP